VAEEQLYLQNEEEKFEADILKIDEEWRDLLRESKYYPDELYSEIFEPKQPWTKWQTTKEYSVQTRMSDRNLICVYSKANVNTSLDNLVKVIEDVDIRSQWDPNMDSAKKIHAFDDVGGAFVYLKLKKIAIVSSRDQYMLV